MRSAKLAPQRFGAKPKPITKQADPKIFGGAQFHPSMMNLPVANRGESIIGFAGSIRASFGESG